MRLQNSGERIKADTINGLAAGQEHVRHNRGAGAALRGELGGSAQAAHAALAAVAVHGAMPVDMANTGASDIKAFQPVEIVGSFFSGTDVLSNLVIEVKEATATAFGNFGIARNPLKVKEVGKGYFSGLCLCRVQTQTGDLVADIASSGDDFLTGDPSIGSAQILWEDGGPSLTTHLALVRFPAGLGSGGNPSARARVISAGDSHSGLAARDGMTPVDGDILLDVNASTASHRGLWVAHSTAWTRPGIVHTSGMLVTVREGTANKDTVWMLETNDPIVLGTTSLSFKQVNQAPNFVVAKARGDTLTHSGTQTIDGVACGVGDLVFDVHDGVVYTVASGAWTVFSSTASFVYIAVGGTDYANIQYVQTSAGSYSAISGCYP